jgi:hypothetical protein
MSAVIFEALGVMGVGPTGRRPEAAISASICEGADTSHLKGLSSSIFKSLPLKLKFSLK